MDDALVSDVPLTPGADHFLFGFKASNAASRLVGVEVKLDEPNSHSALGRLGDRSSSYFITLHSQEPRESGLQVDDGMVENECSIKSTG